MAAKRQVPKPAQPPATTPANGFSFERMVNKFRFLHLALAEAIDVWRVVPRMFIALYGSMLWWLVKWFTHSTTIEKVTCDKDLIIQLLAQKVDYAWIQRMACQVTDVIVVAPPTAVHATFASVVAGLSTAVFALYSSAGKDWNSGVSWWKVGRDKPNPTIPLTPNPTPPPSPPTPTPPAP